MKKINVLVTGVGAIIGYGIIKSIRKSRINCNIIGMDIYEDAVGRNLSDKFIQATLASSSKYIDFLKNVIDKESVDIVFFGTEQEIYKCMLCKNELGKYYDKLVINKTEILELSKDKWLTREYLINNGLGEYAIPSVIDGNYEDIKSLWGEEFLLKPRSSYASKGIHKVKNKEHFDFYKKEMAENFMAQRLIGDNEHEYTVGVFGDGNGKILSMISLKRKLSQEGATAKAYYYEDEELSKVIKKMCKVLKPIGPTNFQFRKEKGKYYLLEINPRISSSTSIRMALGYNESKMSINFFFNKKFNKPNIKHGYAIRYIDEVVVIDE